jgi:hypothetical protein
MGAPRCLILCVSAQPNYDASRSSFALELSPQFLERQACLVERFRIAPKLPLGNGRGSRKDTVNLSLGKRAPRSNWDRLVVEEAKPPRHR